MSNRVTHFKIPSSNPEETMNLFKSTFDWKMIIRIDVDNLKLQFEIAEI